MKMKCIESNETDHEINYETLLIEFVSFKNIEHIGKIIHRLIKQKLEVKENLRNQALSSLIHKHLRDKL